MKNKPTLLKDFEITPQEECQKSEQNNLLLIATLWRKVTFFDLVIAD